jgi:hypothetical protein
MELDVAKEEEKPEQQPGFLFKMRMIGSDDYDRQGPANCAKSIVTRGGGIQRL